MASFQQSPHTAVGAAGASPGGASAAAHDAAVPAPAPLPPPLRMTKTGTRVLATSGVLSNLHARAHAAAYGGPGGADFDRLFRAHSPNGDGHLTRVEWHDLLRKTFKMTVDELTDAQLSTLFSRLDKRNAGVLSIAQLMRYFDPQSSRVATDEQGEEVKFGDSGKSPQASSIAMLRRGLESTSLHDEEGPHMHGAHGGGGTRGAAADDLAEPGEESWHGTVYHQERDTAYDLAAMVAQLREYDTAIAQTQKANDVLHRALRNRDAAREEEKRLREEEMRQQPLRTMLENMPEGLKLERAPWRGNFNFKSPGETIDEMAKTAKLETAASLAAAATPIAPQRLF